MSEGRTGNFVVLKFGGTSVSSLERWETIAAVVERRIAEGVKPVIVCSALSGVSNLLENLVDEAAKGRHEELLLELKARHRALAEEMDLSFEVVLGPDFEELERLALGASLVREVSARLHARMLAFGEIMCTRLGAAYLEKTGRGIAWMDARDCLQTACKHTITDRRRFLSATCETEALPGLQEKFRSLAESAILTQGFIARDADGETVLLGRGGSDTSAAYFAAALEARRCEIWTDVPGVFTANPNQVPGARLIRSLDYEEAQEITSTGAKVLHPNCINSLHKSGIPLHVRCTERPELESTTISSAAREGGAYLKAISSKRGVLLISMEDVNMWRQAGFLADVFAPFKRHGLSIDLVSTSETNVTVSLDAAPDALDARTIEALKADLEPLCDVRLIGPCALVSLVGRNIRAILHRIGPALEVFKEKKVYLLSQAASDLNFSAVVDEEEAERLVRKLHDLLIREDAGGRLFGPTWRELHDLKAENAVSGPDAWWRMRRKELLELAKAESPRYVYDTESLERAADELAALESVGRICYAVKANNHPEILRIFESRGLCFECVSIGEIRLLLKLFPKLDRDRILFTPNFAPKSEYEEGFCTGVNVTLDNLYPLQAWPELFKGREIFVRLDPGQGRGHHKHVHTAGAQSKFGVSPLQIEEFAARAAEAGGKVVGLHAHTGSGILTSENWSEEALFLAETAARFPDVRVLDLGGGLGVPEKPGQTPLDLAAVDESLQKIRRAYPQFELWLEPGRFLVAHAGVLLTTVTQTKEKGERRFVGVDAGMNSLVRPMMYGSYHEIVNLSRLEEGPPVVADVVGPICESGDTFGFSRRLDEPREGDVMLVAVAGAYGRAMSSEYNVRPPAGEVMLEKR